MNRTEALRQLKAAIGSGFVEETQSFGETTVTVEKGKIKDALAWLKRAGGYETLMDLTAVDYLEPTIQTKVIYWLHQPTTMERIRLVTFVKRNERLPTVTDLWAGANWYERELYDMFGIYFDGHNDMKRILMPDDWVGHPMLRDYPLTEEPVEFKHGAEPKVPSQTITHIGGRRV